ncbi:MAG: branched-chain amino acid ABC transporter permease [Alphaproteobacteria bacterium]|nr:branched-chain amino acid ABC transporter permease [Alphaproteobacteria bacterium]
MGHNAARLAVLAALIAVPWVLPVYLTTTVTEVLIFGLFAMSLDLLVGYTGLFSFGHAAGFGIGAYAAALLLLNADMPLPFAIVAGAVAAGLIALPVGWICTRATGVSFAMLTVAFAQLAYAISIKWESLTGGSDGLAGVPRVAGPFGIDWFAARPGFYCLVLGCLVGTYLLCRSLVRSPFGTALEAIRENERKARSLGYDAQLYKIAIFAISSLLAGLAGALYAPFRGYASPELLYWLFSGQVLVMVIVGGARTLLGPVLGAAFFILAEDYLSSITDSWALILGLVYILFVIFFPEGLWGVGHRLRGAKGSPVLPVGSAEPGL